MERKGVNLRKAIIDTTLEIFTTMVMMEISADPEEISETGAFKNSITGVIGLAGTHKGILAIHIPNTMAKAITSSFLMMDVAEINADVHDAVGEVANMLGGNIKTILSENGRDINLSIPSTIAGEQYDFQPNMEMDKELIRFTSTHGSFIVEVQLAK